MARIFLSYDRRDADRAAGVVAALERAGHEVWWDRHIKGGRRFETEIEQALDAADAVVVLWSSDAVRSDWVKDEAASGRDRGRLVPATLDGTLPPLGFRQFQTLDLTKLRPSEATTSLDEAIASAVGSSPPESRPARTSPGMSRRSLLIAGSAALGVGAASAGAWRWLGPGDKPPAEVEALLSQAWQAWTQGTGDGNAQAIGLYRRASEISPDYADSWGLLSCAYGDRGHGMAGAERNAVWERAREAGRRALSLDPRNAYGRMGIAYARPLRGNWGLMEREFRQAEQDQPGKFLVVYSLGLLLGDVGRFQEAAQLLGSLKGAAPTAMQYLFHTQALWASGQPAEAERVIAEADDIFGSHPAIWRQRLDMALHSGKETTAIAQVEDSKARPEAIDPHLVEVVVAAARAVHTRDPAAKRKVADGLSQYARASTGAAGLAIELASLMGQPDAAFQFAEALFFSREFVVPDQAGGAGAIVGATLDDRRTRVLFLPSTAVMRNSSRFDRLMQELGLEAYWRESGSTPDYRKR